MFVSLPCPACPLFPNTHHAFRTIRVYTSTQCGLSFYTHSLREEFKVVPQWAFYSWESKGGTSCTCDTMAFNKYLPPCCNVASGYSLLSFSDLYHLFDWQVVWILQKIIAVAPIGEVYRKVGKFAFDNLSIFSPFAIFKNLKNRPKVFLC